MTIREKLLKLLCDNGLFEAEAQEVLKLYENGPLSESMKGRMDDDENGYPEMLMATVWVGIRSSAVTWIDENQPQHWARPMFAE